MIFYYLYFDFLRSVNALMVLVFYGGDTRLYHIPYRSGYNI